jgi:23S rRNA U2552 (ribose-2'-O)-methylase RlmE/FtsJ
MYPLLIFELSKNDKNSDFVNCEDLTLLLPFKLHPQFKLGYHHFIDRTRDAINITKKLDTKNEFYYVINEFETKIQDYDDNIENLSKIYFGDNKITFGRDFYIFWEILFIFNLINKNIKSITNISNNLSDSIDAIIFYSEKILNIDGSKIEINNVNIIQEKEFEYNTTKENQFLNKTIKKENFVLPSKFIKSNKTSDFIIANSENYYSSINTKEDESYKLLLGELLVVLKSLNKDGTLIFKMYDTFTIITVKIVFLIVSLFDNVVVYKPLLSRQSDSDKYLICQKYKYDNSDKNIKKLANSIEKILKLVDSNNFLNDIFIDIEVPNTFQNDFKFINTKLVNLQQILINEIVKYIKENNYFGDKFHENKNKQIEATKWWVKTFYPPSNNIYQTNKDLLDKLLKTTINKNNLEKEKFLSNFM